MSELTLGLFSPHLNEEFELVVDGSKMLLKLVEASALPVPDAFGSGPGGGERCREPFTLLFQSPREPVLGQDLYEIRHPQIGPHHLFFVPVNADTEGVYYEALFN